MDWKEAVRRWRSLPPAEKARRRWQRIPRNVAQSMAFEGEPVDERILEELHACESLPPDISKRPSAS